MLFSISIYWNIVDTVSTKNTIKKYKNLVIISLIFNRSHPIPHVLIANPLNPRPKASDMEVTAMKKHSLSEKESKSLSNFISPSTNNKI